MGPAEEASTYRSIIAAVSAGDGDRLDDLIAGDLLDHDAIPGQAGGLAGFKYWMQVARTAFPDLAGVVEDTVVAGDKVAGRVTWRGTHRGDFVGVPGTGVGVEFQAFHIVAFTGGVAVQWWGTADLLGALMQAGATIGPPG